MINLTPITHQLPAIAFALFREWNKAVAPTEVIAIKDEGQLVEDLRKAVKSALISLGKRNDLPLKPPGWDTGFVLGFIEGSLSRKWHHEYIFKNSEAYKIFAGLKAIQAYLKFDELVRVRMETLYRHFLETNTNLLEVTPEISKRDLDPEKGTFFTTDEQEQLSGILDILIICQIEQMTAEKTKVDLDIKEYFDVELIRKLIELNLNEENSER